MRIACPWCGPRPLSEYTYGGDAGKTRPPDSSKASLDAWMDYVYLRDNPDGRHREYWQHTNGCRSWLVVTRDTANHEISKTKLANTLAGGSES